MREPEGRQRIGDRMTVSLTHRIADADGSILEQRDLPVGHVHGCGSELLDKLEAPLTGKVAGDRVSVTLHVTVGGVRPATAEELAAAAGAG